MLKITYNKLTTHLIIKLKAIKFKQDTCKEAIDKLSCDDKTNHSHIMESICSKTECETI